MSSSARAARAYFRVANQYFRVQNQYIRFPEHSFFSPYTGIEMEENKSRNLAAGTSHTFQDSQALLALPTYGGQFVILHGT
jgi:hypothetical protein